MITAFIQSFLILETPFFIFQKNPPLSSAKQELFQCHNGKICCYYNSLTFWNISTNYA